MRAVSCSIEISPMSPIPCNRFIHDNGYESFASFENSPGASKCSLDKLRLQRLQSFESSMVDSLPWTPNPMSIFNSHCSFDGSSGSGGSGSGSGSTSIACSSKLLDPLSDIYVGNKHKRHNSYSTNTTPSDRLSLLTIPDENDENDEFDVLIDSARKQYQVLSDRSSKKLFFKLFPSTDSNSSTKRSYSERSLNSLYDNIIEFSENENLTKLCKIDCALEEYALSLEPNISSPTNFEEENHVNKEMRHESIS